MTGKRLWPSPNHHDKGESRKSCLSIITLLRQCAKKVVRRSIRASTSYNAKPS
jgi:hypothetical protein